MTNPVPETGRRVSPAPLRLRALDAEDVAVMAACLQDALVPLSEMVYLPAERRFLAAFTRFRRECLADPGCCEGLTQCQSVLAVDQVEAVKYHGLDRRFGRVRLELLTMIAAPAGAQGLGRITLLFAGDVAIQLHVRALAATLEDFGDPWAARVAPRHEPSTAGV